MKKTIGALMVAVSATAFAANASAYEFTPYVGVDYNYTTVSSASAQFNSGSINVGTMYNQYFGTEAFYQLSTDDKKGGDYQSKTHMQAYGLDLMGYLPLGCDQTFSLIGSLGYGQYKITSKDTTTNATERDYGYAYRYGLGAMYNIDENISIRAMARYIDVRDIDVDHMMEYSLGARYNF